MFLKYETGLVTLIQFIVMSLLSLANSLNSIITTCVNQSNSCIENTIPSIILFIMITAWFGFMWVLGFSVQERRGRKLSAALIAAEGMTAMVALFSIRHYSDWLGRITSIIDLVFAIIVIILAVRIFFAGNRRVVSHSRGRSRRRPTVDR